MLHDSTGGRIRAQVLEKSQCSSLDFEIWCLDLTAHVQLPLRWRGHLQVEHWRLGLQDCCVFLHCASTGLLTEIAAPAHHENTVVVLPQF